MMRRIRLLGAAVFALSLLASAPALANDAPLTEPPISAQQLAEAVKILNTQSLVVPAGSVPPSSAARLAAAAQEVPSLKDRIVGESISSVSTQIEEMASRMRSADRKVSITSVKVTVESEKFEDGVNFVTLFVSRTLAEGSVWQEVEPYAVVEAPEPGSALTAGQIFSVGREVVESGDLPADLGKFDGVTKIGAGDEAGSVHPSGDGSDSDRAASTTPPPAGGGAKEAARAVVAGLPSSKRQKVKNYAYKYAYDPNDDYHEYDNDCTNFVSQALRYGGWTEINGDHDDNSKWWYDGWWPHYASYTWAGAENFYKFAIIESGRATPWGNVYDLRNGDILQYKLDGRSTMTHSMVTTGHSQEGVPLLSYHTTNTRDKPFTAMVITGRTWYAHKV